MRQDSTSMSLILDLYALLPSNPIIIKMGEYYSFQILVKKIKENARFRNSCTIFHGKGLTSNSKYGSWVSSHQMQIYGRAKDERFSKKEKLTIWMGGNCCSRKTKWYLLTLILIYPASVIARRNISRIVLNISICFFLGQWPRSYSFMFPNMWSLTLPASY